MLRAGHVCSKFSSELVCTGNVPKPEPHSGWMPIILCLTDSYILCVLAKGAFETVSVPSLFVEDTVTIYEDLPMYPELMSKIFA